MSKVLFLVNHDVVIYNFRLELVERLLADGHEVVISSPYGDRIEDLKNLGCDYKEIAISRHGVNPVKDLKLIKSYKKLLREVKPDIVFSYTIKPNIYGAIACKSKKIPIVVNITGLGTAVEQKGILQFITLSLYKYAFRKVKKVFFQNEENQRFFIRHKIALNRQELLPGSGVNLKRFPILEYPGDEIIKFVFVGRIMKEKGIDYYLKTAEYIKLKYSNTEFHVCGFVEAEYKGKLEDFIRRGIIIYHGLVKDVSEIHKQMHCLVFPSYYPEGMSNVLLEAEASGRPVITTDRAGCREAVDDGKTGFLIPLKNQEALNQAIEKFILLSNVQRKEMGIAGRKKVEREFDRNIVVNKYIDELKSL